VGTSAGGAGVGARRRELNRGAWSRCRRAAVPRTPRSSSVSPSLSPLCPAMSAPPPWVRHSATTYHLPPSGGQVAVDTFPASRRSSGSDHGPSERKLASGGEVVFVEARPRSLLALAGCTLPSQDRQIVTRGLEEGRITFLDPALNAI